MSNGGAPSARRKTELGEDVVSSRRVRGMIEKRVVLSIYFRDCPAGEIGR